MAERFKGLTPPAEAWAWTVLPCTIQACGVQTRVWCSVHPGSIDYDYAGKQGVVCLHHLQRAAFSASQMLTAASLLQMHQGHIVWGARLQRQGLFCASVLAMQVSTCWAS